MSLHFVKKNWSIAEKPTKQINSGRKFHNMHTKNYRNTIYANILVL
jgi:hypothetical protein